MRAWTETTLGEIVEIFDHKRVPLSSNQRSKRQGSYRYYGAQGVIDWIDDYIFDGRFLLVPEDGENLRSRKLPIALLTDGQFWVNNHAHVLQAKEGVAIDRFLQGAIESTNIDGFVTGAAQPKLSQANLRRIPIRLPPLPVQVRIAQLLATFDDLITKHTHRIEILDSLAQAIYREWFVDFRYPGHENVPLLPSGLGPLPQGWASVPMPNVADVIDCSHAKKPMACENGPGILVQLSNIEDRGILNLDNPYRISAADYESWTARIELSGGDCIVTNVGRVGAVAQVPDGEHAALGRNMTALRAKYGGITPAFLIGYLRSSHMRTETERNKDSGVIMDALNVKGIRRLNVPLPPSHLVREYDDLASPMRRAMDVAVQQVRLLRSIRDVLLPRLVSGEVDVSTLDAQDLVA
jgi:type I restriction enzyme S subunit